VCYEELKGGHKTLTSQFLYHIFPVHFERVNFLVVYYKSKSSFLKTVLNMLSIIVRTLLIGLSFGFGRSVGLSVAAVYLGNSIKLFLFFRKFT
jgi:hypothetical protein